MKINTNRFREPKWFSNSLKHMSDIAAELPQIKFYDGVRNDIIIDANMPLKKNKFQSVYGSISYDLLTLAHHSMINGAISVLKGDESAWAEIRRGFLYDGWAARFRHAFIIRDNCYDQKNNPASSAVFNGKEALTLCHAIVTGDDRFARGFGSHVFNNFRKTNGSDLIYFYTFPFFAFVIKLYSYWVGEEVAFRSDVPDPMGRYQQIFDHWNSSESRFKEVVLDICDLHCEDSSSSRTYSAFAFPPYNIFPVEILALYRIRKELGLPVPELVHPLIQSALAKPPEQIPDVQDELLQVAIQRFHADFPDGIGW